MSVKKKVKLFGLHIINTPIIIKKNTIVQNVVK